MVIVKVDIVTKETIVQCGWRMVTKKPGLCDAHV